jgi:hypothetical protein
MVPLEPTAPRPPGPPSVSLAVSMTLALRQDAAARIRIKGLSFAVQNSRTRLAAGTR